MTKSNLLVVLRQPHHLQAGTCQKKDSFLFNTVHAAGPHKLAPNILCPQLCTALHATMTL